MKFKPPKKRRFYCPYCRQPFPDFWARHKHLEGCDTPNTRLRPSAEYLAKVVKEYKKKKDAGESPYDREIR